MRTDDAPTIPQLPTASVQAHEIQWAPEPIAPLERVDVLGLPRHELLSYICDLQEEAESLRGLLHASVALVAEQRDKLARAARMTEHLRREYLTFRQQHGTPA